MISLLASLALMPTIPPTDHGVWGEARNGLRARIDFERPHRQYAAGVPLRFTVVLRNESGKPVTLNLKSVTSWHASLSAGARLNLSASSGEAKPVTLNTGEELDLSTGVFLLLKPGEPALPAMGMSHLALDPGKYRMRIDNPFWQPDPEDPSRATGLDVKLPEVEITVAGGPTGLFRGSQGRVTKQPVSWGEPVQGIQLGTAPQDEGKVAPNHVKYVLTLRNLRREPIRLVVWSYPQSEMVPNVEDLAGKGYMPSSVRFSGLLASHEITLKSGEVYEFGRPILDTSGIENRAPAPNSPPVLKAPKGKYTLTYHVAVRLAEAGTDLSLQSGKAGLEVR